LCLRIEEQNAGSFLHLGNRGVLRSELVFHESVRQALGGIEDIIMDYIIAGVTSVFLFGYLIYALLKPEKF
jgi:K+-transporting ATPase KdpF subunit